MEVEWSEAPQSAESMDPHDSTLVVLPVDLHVIEVDTARNRVPSIVSTVPGQLMMSAVQGSVMEFLDLPSSYVVNSDAHLSRGWRR